ncbi:hypothetical protein CPB85DRAFT_1230453 [Mucidula mucida]|nr:hypothetical protein CPB85DRAFT_1230453 [Mucidula mucida]
MGRWTQYDEDEYRLPEGMERIGYDADSQTYTFRDADGSIWKGAEGAEYSEMTKVSDAPSAADADAENDVDLEALPRRADGYQPLAHQSPVSITPASLRSLFPFFLIIGVVLLLFFRLFPFPTSSSSNPCPKPDTSAYWARPGDTCWDIAVQHGVTLEELELANPSVNCERLMPGNTLCLPVKD